MSNDANWVTNDGKLFIDSVILNINKQYILQYKTITIGVDYLPVSFYQWLFISDYLLVII